MRAKGESWDGKIHLDVCQGLESFQGDNWPGKGDGDIFYPFVINMLSPMI